MILLSISKKKNWGKASFKNKKKKYKIKKNNMNCPFLLYKLILKYTKSTCCYIILLFYHFITYITTDPLVLKVFIIAMKLVIYIICIYILEGGEVLLCAPPSNDEDYSNASPAPDVNYARKPVLVSDNLQVTRNNQPLSELPSTLEEFLPRAELSATPIPRAELSATPIPRAELSATPIARWELSATPVPRLELPATPVPVVELPATPVPVVELPATLVPVVELPATPVNLYSSSNTSDIVPSISVNNTPLNSPYTSSMAVNIDSPGVNNSINSSVATQNASIASHINELGADTSLRSSVDAQDGSVTYTTQGQTYPVVYLDPDSELHSAAYDYTERVGPKVGPIDRIATFIRSKDSELEAASFKYYTVGKRKIYWQIWEKHTNRYDSYREYKANWDPNTNILRKLYKSVKSTAKSNLKEGFSSNSNTRAVRSGGTTQQVNELLRTRRHRHIHR